MSRALCAFALVSVAARFLSGAASLSISPPVIYDCTDGLGQATLTWTGASGPVQVHVSTAQGPALTGFNPASGTARTDSWVSDGMTFFLVDQQGVTEASVTARVQCGGSANTLDQGIQGGSYFPLQIGNTWVYRYNARFITSVYVTFTAAYTEEVNDKTYFVIEETDSSPATVALIVRGDSAGRLWALTGPSSNPQETLLLDPSVAIHAPYSGPLGAFPDGASISIVSGGVLQTSQVFVRGVGLAHTYSTMLTGSSGGFTDGMDLVEARLGGGIDLVLPAPRLSLTLESLLLDVTGHMVMNCAVPCYFVACGFSPGTDPSGTYKPCAQVRLEGTAGGTSNTLDLEVDDATGKAVYHAPSASAETLEYVQIPLYSQPNQPFPPGQYQLVGRLSSGGTQVAGAQISFQIK